MGAVIKYQDEKSSHECCKLGGKFQVSDIPASGKQESPESLAKKHLDAHKAGNRKEE